MKTTFYIYFNHDNKHGAQYCLNRLKEEGYTAALSFLSHENGYWCLMVSGEYGDTSTLETIEEHLSSMVTGYGGESDGYEIEVA